MLVPWSRRWHSMIIVTDDPLQTGIERRTERALAESWAFFDAVFAFGDAISANVEPTMPTKMPSDRRFVFTPMTAIALAMVVICLIIAVVYFTTSAGNLPAFFPGHQAHSAHKHMKHGLAFIGLAVAGLFAAWFTTAPSRDSS